MTAMINPKRCTSCGTVSVCACRECPACGRNTLRELNDAERATWQAVSASEGEKVAAVAVAVRCGL